MWRIVFSPWLIVSLLSTKFAFIWGTSIFPSLKICRVLVPAFNISKSGLPSLDWQENTQISWPFLSKYTPFRPQAFFHLILKVLLDPRYSVLCWPSLWTVGNVENMRRREWELLFHINCAGHFQVLKSLQLPGMRSLSLLSVIFHCFCQTALGQQDELGHQVEEQGLVVQEYGDYLASLNSSDKIRGSEQTWKKQKL